MVLAAAANGVPAAVVLRAFDAPSAAGWIAGGLVPPFVSAWWAARARRRVSPVWSVTASLTAWLLVVCVLTTAGSAGGLRSVATGLLDGVIPVLNMALPAPTRPDLVAVPSALIFAAALGSAELTARGHTALLPMLPPMVLLAAGTALTVPLPGTNLVAAGALTAIAVAFVARRHAVGAPLPAAPAGATHTTRRRLATPGAVALVTVAGLAVALSPLPATGDRYDPRADLRHTVDLAAQADPLALVAKWLAEPDQVLFRVRQEKAASWQNWRLVTLDDFDGRDWRLSRRFLPAGRRVPAPADLRGRTNKQTIQIAGLDGVLLPAEARPTTVDGVDFAVEPASATLLSAEPVTAALTYRVNSTTPTTPTAEVAARLVPAADATPGSLDYPPAVPAVLEKLSAVAAGAPTAYQRAVRLEQHLRSNWEYHPKASSGHSFGSVRSFLETPRAQGTSVVFATAFALGARLLGLPCRLVVGFTPGVAVPPGTDHEVRSGDVVVWPEVDFAGAGWIPFYPTPQESKLKDAPGLGQVPPAEAEPPPPGDGNDQPSQGPSAPTAGPGIPPVTVSPLPASTRWIWPAAAAGVALLVALYSALVTTAPARRRRRRRAAADPRSRVLGAWHDMLDALSRAGVEIPRSATPSEIDRLAVTALGTRAQSDLAALTALASRALFAAEAPSGTDADRAWATSDELRPRISRHASLGKRLRGGLSPRRMTSAATATRKGNRAPS